MFYKLPLLEAATTPRLLSPISLPELLSEYKISNDPTYYTCYSSNCDYLTFNYNTYSSTNDTLPPLSTIVTIEGKPPSKSSPNIKSKSSSTSYTMGTFSDMVVS